MQHSKKIIFYISLIACLVFQTLPVIRSGLIYKYGMGFWGPNGHDGVWHLSLINHIENPLKINLPIMAGEQLSNYHPFFDILIKGISSITKISTTNLLFQIFPIVTAFIFLYLSFKVGGYVLMFLNTFATSIGPFIGKGETAFWSMQSASNQLNPPFILSLVFLLTIIFFLKKQKLSQIHFILISIILIILPITKVYSAPIGFFLFFVYCFKQFKLKNIVPSLYLIGSTILAIILFLTFNPSSNQVLVYKPLWFIHTMFESKDRFYIPKIVNMIYTLKESPVFSPRLLAINTIGVFIFIIGNYSFRILAFTKRKYEYLFLIFLTTLIPLLFIQKGTAWNTIQFMYYGLFLANILLAEYLNKKKNLAIIIIILSFFANFPIYKNYLGNPAPTSISQKELNALNFLKKQEKGIVLTQIYDQFLKEKYKSTPIPLYAYETTAYVSAFTQKEVFLEDEMNLQILGKDYQSRKENSLLFFNQNNIHQDRGFLVNNKIDYIYLPKEFTDNLSDNELALGIKKIFENEQILVFKVQR
jgi:hypothetical protein